MCPQMFNRCPCAIWQHETRRKHVNARNYQGNDGDDLDQGEPEFNFTEVAHIWQVEQQ
ncbi:hypothetical protein D3C80_790880 [compost metagenome]